MTIAALDAGDGRAIDLRVAGPAALLSAKLTKLRERYEDMQAGRGKPRIKEKDVLDCYRVLLAIETNDLERGFESHRDSTEALVVTRAALGFFEEQRRREDQGVLRTLLGQALPGDLTALAAFDALSGDLVDAVSGDLVAAG